MRQTIKLRKNKLNTRHHMKGGAMEDGMKVFIAGLQTAAASSKIVCVPALVIAKKAALSTFMNTIPDEPNTNNLINSLGVKATLKELIKTSLTIITCDDIGVIATVLPKLLVFDKIQDLLNTTDEAAKKTTEFYATLHDIITDSKNQDLACRVLTAFKDENYITDDHIKAFSIFIVGKENICQGGVVSNISESAKNLWSTLSGKKTGDSAENTNDKRCGEKLIVKKSMIVGDYCAPKPEEAPAKPVGEAPKPEQAPPPANPDVESSNQVLPPPPAKPVGEAPKPEQAPPPSPPTDKNASDNMKGGKRQKYKRVNKSKKNKKSKSKKSKRAKK